MQLQYKTNFLKIKIRPSSELDTFTDYNGYMLTTTC